MRASGMEPAVPATTAVGSEAKKVTFSTLTGGLQSK